jgi:hypothetical protein
LALTAAIDVPSYPRSPAISTVASRIRCRDSTPFARFLRVVCGPVMRSTFLQLE